MRDILSFDEEVFIEDVETALGVDAVTIHELVDGRHKFSFKPSAPSSILVGIGPKESDMTKLKITLKSDYVEECLAKKHLKTSWYAVLNEVNSSNRGNLFESYTRLKFSQGPARFSTNEARESMRTRPTHGKKNEKKNYQPLQSLTIGSNRTILRVSNMIEAVCADTSQEHLYYSKDEHEPLIDMVFRVDGGFHAIQSTVGVSHNAETAKIRTLKAELRLRDDQTLTIFYAVPSLRYHQFVTDPVNPLLDQSDLNNVVICHVGISASND